MTHKTFLLVMTLIATALIFSVPVSNLFKEKDNTEKEPPKEVSKQLTTYNQVVDCGVSLSKIKNPWDSDLYWGNVL